MMKPAYFARGAFCDWFICDWIIVGVCGSSSLTFDIAV
jgi:hypothetical protein